MMNSKINSIARDVGSEIRSELLDIISGIKKYGYTYNSFTPEKQIALNLLERRGIIYADCKSPVHGPRYVLTEEGRKLAKRVKEE